MPTTPLQFAIGGLELCLLLAGAWLVWQVLGSPVRRARWLGTQKMPNWPLTIFEFLLFLFLVVSGWAVVQAAMQSLFGAAIQQAVDREGLSVMVYGTGAQGGAILGGFLFAVLRRRWHSAYGEIPPAAPTPSLSWRRCFALGGGTLLVLLPVVYLLGFGWNFLLRHLGLPDEPQELVAIFARTHSPLVIAGMLGVACLIAPLNEELIFRAGIYRYCRQTLGRPWALVISSTFFGAMHGSLAGFLPLAVLGGILCLAYEATGNVRVVVIAHGLFNLNTIVMILSGLSST